MIIARIDAATRVLGAPADWNEERDGTCGSLAIRDVEIAGQNVMVSAWQPTPEEIAAIVAGATVRLYVWGSRHPPVSIGVGELPS